MKSINFSAITILMFVISFINYSNLAYGKEISDQENPSAKRKANNINYHQDDNSEKLSQSKYGKRKAFASHAKSKHEPKLSDNEDDDPIKIKKQYKHFSKKNWLRVREECEPREYSKHHPKPFVAFSPIGTGEVYFEYNNYFYKQ